MKFTDACIALTLLAGALAARSDAAPASAPGPSAPLPASPPALPSFEPFPDLPPPVPRPGAGDRTQVHAGTRGLALATPASAAGAPTSVAILGDLAPGAPADREKFLRMAVTEINLLHPDAVLTVGNLIPGLTRSGTQYVEETRHARNLLDDLKMPWYPCAGYTDIFSGTRAAADRRFEDLYQRYVGPLYFSADVGGTETPGGPGAGCLHVIVLDSQESAGTATIGPAQLQWLRSDLNRTFDQARAQGVILLLHLPLWQNAGTGGGNWQQVHDLLVEFNRRPIASFEGGTAAGSGGSGRAPVAHGPRVLAVFAGGRQAYDQEPTRDGIRYCVLGPTAAAPRAGEADEAIRHFTLIKLDAAGGLYTALVQLGPTDPSAPVILPEDVVTAQERAVMDAVAGWNEAAFGIDGIVDERGAPLGRPLNVHFANPLSEAFDVQLRTVPGGGWDFTAAPFQRHLAAAGALGAQGSADFGLRRIRAGTDLPVVQAVVRWPDGRGRVHTLVLARPIAVAPSVDVPVADKPIALDDTAGWGVGGGAPGGSATAWSNQPDRPPTPDPAIALRADGDRLLVQVRVSDPTASYWPALTLDPAWGGIASDAVSLAWARGDRQVQRLWVLPFAPPAAPPTLPAPPVRVATPATPRTAASRAAPAALPEIWSNTGLGDRQTPLQRLDPKAGIQASITLDTGGYTVVFSLPRKLVCDEIPAPQPAPGLPLLTPAPPPTRVAASTLLNVAVHDNDQTARTWTKSWTLEEAGPEAWAHIQLIQATPVPPGLHLP